MQELNTQILVDRKLLCRMLGNISLSHIIRLEKNGRLSEARVQVGLRAVRYNLSKIKQMISGGSLI